MQPEPGDTEQPAKTRPAWLLLTAVGVGALVVGGVLGGVAGASIAGTSASQDLVDVASALEASESEIAGAENRVADLEGKIADLESQITDLEATVPPPPPEPTPVTGNFPDGFPVVVPVSELPDQVRSWYERSSFTEAVALAPGVWTPLSPGADMASAIAAGGADGFCASKEAYERDYAGEGLSGTCW